MGGSDSRLGKPAWEHEWLGRLIGHIQWFLIRRCLVAWSVDLIGLFFELI